VKKQAYLDDMEKKINQDKLYRELHRNVWHYYPDADMGGSTAGVGSHPKAIQSILDKYK
jgi:hypothetical protein